MAYCTQSDLEKLLPKNQLIRLTDDEGLEAVDTVRIAEVIDSAAEEIDAYIGEQIKLPITGTVPPILGKFNADIAIYNLYSRLAETIPETRADRYANAIKTLEKIALGKISIGIQPPPDPPAENEYHGAGSSSTRDKMFDSTTMDKF